LEGGEGGSGDVVTPTSVTPLLCMSIRAKTKPEELRDRKLV